MSQEPELTLVEDAKRVPSVAKHAMATAGAIIKALTCRAALTSDNFLSVLRPCAVTLYPTGKSCTS